MKYVFLILFYFIPVVSGYDGLFSILDETYADNVTALHPSSELPDMSWQYCSGNIDDRWAMGWVDIVGFEGMTVLNGTSYVNGSPETRAIVRYDYKGLRGETVFWKPSTRTYQAGNSIIAELTLERKWFEIFCGESSCYPIYYQETMIISDSEPAPLVYPSIPDVSVNITLYNNSFNPRTAVAVNFPGNLSKVTYRFKNETLTHYLLQGHEEINAKGISYLNLTYNDFWTNSTGSMQRFNTAVIIQNLSIPIVEVSTPYETRTIYPSNYSYERLTYNSGSTFSDPLIMFVSILTTFFILSITVIMRP